MAYIGQLGFQIAAKSLVDLKPVSRKILDISHAGIADAEIINRSCKQLSKLILLSNCDDSIDVILYFKIGIV